MTEWEKAQAGFLYDANYEPELIAMRKKCADLCWEFNLCRPSDTEKQQELLRSILGEIKGRITVTAPFYCDYGTNISVGDNFYTNHNVTILDGAKVTFGDYNGPQKSDHHFSYKNECGRMIEKERGHTQWHRKRTPQSIRPRSSLRFWQESESWERSQQRTV